MGLASARRRGCGDWREAQKIALGMLLQQLDQGHVDVGHRGLLRSVVEVRKLHHKPTSSMGTPATPQARRESPPRPWTLLEKLKVWRRDLGAFSPTARLETGF
jgi:hypothetical protein